MNDRVGKHQRKDWLGKVRGNGRLCRAFFSMQNTLASHQPDELWQCIFLETENQSDKGGRILTRRHWEVGDFVGGSDAMGCRVSAIIKFIAAEAGKVPLDHYL